MSRVPDECWNCGGPLKSVYFDVVMKDACTDKDLEVGVFSRGCLRCALKMMPGVNEDNLDAVFNWREILKREHDWLKPEGGGTE